MSEARKPTQVEIIPPPPGPPNDGLQRRSEPTAPVSPLRRLLARVPGVPTLYGLGLYLMDDEGSDLHRFLILMMLLYFISPVDLLPDYLLGPLGFTDDLGMLMGLVRFIGSEQLEPYRDEARRRLRGLPPGKE